MFTTMILAVLVEVPLLAETVNKVVSLTKQFAFYCESISYFKTYQVILFLTLRLTFLHFLNINIYLFIVIFFSRNLKTELKI